MSILFLVKGLLSGLAVSAPLGPMGIMCIRNALQKGWSSAFYIGLGIALADTLFAIVAGYSVTFVHQFLDEYAGILRFIGALILLVISWKILRSHPAEPFRNKEEKPHLIWRDMLSAFIVTVSNPLTILFFGSFFASIAIPTHTDYQQSVVLLVVGVFLGAMLWWLFLGGIVHKYRAQFSIRHIFWINRVTGSIILALALWGIIGVGLSM